MKLALYRLATYPNSSPDPYQVSDLKENGKDWVRMSEIVEVEFPPRNPDEIIQQNVRCIDQEIAVEVRDHLQRLNDLKETKSKLLCLTYESPVKVQTPVPHPEDNDIPF